MSSTNWKMCWTMSWPKRCAASSTSFTCCHPPTARHASIVLTRPPQKTQYITPQQYAATIDSFIRRLRVDIPPHAEGTPLTELYKRFLVQPQASTPSAPAALLAPHSNTTNTTNTRRRTTFRMNSPMYLQQPGRLCHRSLAALGRMWRR